MANENDRVMITRAKISRIGDVEVLEELWNAEDKHSKPGMDAFRMSGDKTIRVKLQMSLLAKNLMVEEYPLSERDIKYVGGNKWMLDTNVYSFLGIGRFYLGQMNEIQIVDSSEFKEYILGFITKYAPGK